MDKNLNSFVEFFAQWIQNCFGIDKKYNVTESAAAQLRIAGCGCLGFAQEILPVESFVEGLQKGAAFDVLRQECSAAMLDGGLCSLQGRLDLCCREEGMERRSLCVSAVLGREGEDFRILQLHFSVAAKQENEMDVRSDGEIHALLGGLPGGMVSVKSNWEMDILKLSDGLLHTLGFAREDLQGLFGSKFLRMVHEDDIERVYRGIERLLRGETVTEMEYRLRHKDGSFVWMLGRGQLGSVDGEAVLNCLLTDISRIKNEQEELKLSLERHEIVMAQNSSVIFEWDIPSGTIELSPNKERGFGGLSWLEGGGVKLASYVHPDYVEVFEEARDALGDGKDYEEIEVLMAGDGVHYIWCRLRGTLKRDASGAPHKVVGVITNIDEEKKQAASLLERAERDTLTGLYNRGTAQALTAQVLSEMPGNQMCAVFMIDTDDFKRVNDTYGHLSGDVILSDIAAMLKRMFRANDVIGRIGGDEFFVLMRNVRSLESVEQKAQDIIEGFHGLRAQGEEFQISCSMGISIAPNDGSDFETLYKKADIALYMAKEKGKERYFLYRDNMKMPALWRPTRTAFDEKNETMAGGNAAVNMGLIEYMFSALDESADVDTAIPLILEIIGRQMDVSRVYLFEGAHDGPFVGGNTLCWCADGVASRIGDMQGLGREELKAYYGLFNENGLLYCRDLEHLPQELARILDEQGIRSMLQSTIMDKGEVRGFIGFDECRENRIWTKEQINTLLFLSKILGTFLLRERAQQRAGRMLESLRMLLNQQDVGIHVLDAGTHEILYANEKMYRILPSLKLNEKCYTVFDLRNSPCEECPILKTPDADRMEVQTFSKALNQSFTCKFSKIPWVDGRQAYVLSYYGLD